MSLMNFPMNWVIDMDYPDVKKIPASNGNYLINCPFCNQKKFYVGSYVAKCHHCGDGYNAMTLHAKACGVPFKVAYKDLQKRWQGLSSDLKVKLSTPVVEEPKYKVAPLWVRDAVYSEFLKLLSLSDNHKANLISRGLSENKIEELRIKSAPEKDLDISVAIKNALKGNNELRKYFKTHKDVRIPALYDVNTLNPKAVSMSDGMLIPIVVKNPYQRDEWIHGNATRNENLISGFQVRLMKGNKRYLYYESSKKKTGASFSGCESIHFVLPDTMFDEDKFEFIKPSLPRVILTEGCLKADVASHLSNNTPFIAVMGVSNQKYLTDAVELLKREYGTKKIVLAFDMDYVDNINVHKALDKAIQTITSLGLEVEQCYWHKEYKEHNIKGIDDLLLYRKQQRGV